MSMDKFLPQKPKPLPVKIEPKKSEPVKPVSYRPAPNIDMDREINKPFLVRKTKRTIRD